MAVEVPRRQITPAGDGSPVCHLENPEPGRALGTVKGSTKPVNQQEDVLE
jgi:hypothetical protein